MSISNPLSYILCVIVCRFDRGVFQNLVEFTFKTVDYYSIRGAQKKSNAVQVFDSDNDDNKSADNISEVQSPLDHPV